MRKNPLQEIVNRIIWNKEDATITYIDRKQEISIKKISGQDVEKAGTEFIFLKDGTMIPYHRIRYIEISGKVVYPTKQ